MIQVAKHPSPEHDCFRIDGNQPAKLLKQSLIMSLQEERPANRLGAFFGVLLLPASVSQPLCFVSTCFYGLGCPDEFTPLYNYRKMKPFFCSRRSFRHQFVQSPTLARKPNKSRSRGRKKTPRISSRMGRKMSAAPTAAITRT